MNALSRQITENPRMLSANILRRTHYIQHGSKAGTGFTVDVDGKQYLITASHIIEGLQPHSKLYIFRNGAMGAIQIGAVWVSDSGADLAVVDLINPISPQLPVKFGTPATYFLSEPAYFLGFPFGLKAEIGDLNDGYPIPFVKSGIVASFDAHPTTSQLIFLDGYSNPGFSGGPIVTVSGDSSVNIIGVVSALNYTDEPIYKNNKPTGLTYEANMGLVVGYNLTEARARIKSHPHGAPLV